MVGEGMLRELEAMAWAQGAEAGTRGRWKEGLKAGREEGSRRMARLSFERKFRPTPSPFQEAFARARGPSELDGIMAACVTEPRAEGARILGVGVH